MEKKHGFTLRHLVLLLIAALVLARLASMAALPLMDTTEARYGEIGRKMAALGDWVTPWHDDGVPFWGKPPLSFWLTAASFRLLGVNEFAARLPHALCALAIAGLVWGLARRHDPREALPALALLTGSTLFFVSAGAVMTDGALVLGTTLAMHGFWQALHAPTHGQRQRAGWSFFIGLAIGLLAKGPLALVLAGTPLLAWLAWARRWRDAWRALPWLRGTVLALALALPWYVLAERRTPGFLQYFIAGEHWHRFVTPGWQGDLYGTAHRFAPGTIWLFAAAGLLPWTVVLPLAAWHSRRHSVDAASATPAERQWLAYLLLWSAAPLLFFTASRNIIWTYPLPGLPAGALLGAAWLVRRRLRVEAWLAAGLSLALALSGVAWAQAAHSGAIGRATAKSAVQAWRRLGIADQPLVVVGGPLFSAAFYSRDQAHRVQQVAQIQPQWVRDGAFVAVSGGRQDQFRPAGFDIERNLGRFGSYELFKLRLAEPAPATGHGTAP
ncbi:ArnT family glycosyltransferase [Azohydromonas australica]|uniref:ArnT family glycosyltransferase n=1 Tax=Azohydromonas australica TaxID=364039 RepID=UPI000686D1CB|nr:glycosyltransferase family 39 protein [Azohydromonas australica]